MASSKDGSQCSSSNVGMIIEITVTPLSFTISFECGRLRRTRLHPKSPGPAAIGPIQKYRRSIEVRRDSAASCQAVGICVECRHNESPGREGGSLGESTRR